MPELLQLFSCHRPTGHRTFGRRTGTANLYASGFYTGFRIPSCFRHRYGFWLRVFVQTRCFIHTNSLRCGHRNSANCTRRLHSRQGIERARDVPGRCGGVLRTQGLVRTGLTHRLWVVYGVHPLHILWVVRLPARRTHQQPRRACSDHRLAQFSELIALPAPVALGLGTCGWCSGTRGTLRARSDC